MSSKYRISTKWTKSVLEAMARNRLNVEKLCKEAGLSYEKLVKNGEFVPQRDLLKLWEVAVNATSDNNLGLIVGSKQSVIGIDNIAYTFMSCENLHHAFQTLAKQMIVICNSVNIVVVEEQKEFWVDVQIECNDGRISDQSYDSVIAWMVHMAKWVSITDVKPIKAFFSHPAHNNFIQYEEVLDCPVEFNSNKTGLLFSETDFVRAIPTANKVLAQFHEQSILEDSAEIDPKHFVNQIRAIVKTLIHQQKLKIEDVSSRFHMSKRTFQRRLEDHGWTFRDLADDIRKSLAIEYVCQDKYTCQGTAEKLGYAESASFLRGFKRWYGCTPREYRIRHYLPMIRKAQDKLKTEPRIS